jgi:ATP-dependent Clp protease protease subunit
MPKEPVRIFEGSTKPHERFWTVRNEADKEPELEFYGFISEYSWFDDDITPQMFKADLEKIGNGGPITIRLNSGGGDVFAASVIRSMLVEYPGRVTVRIDGLCASAATFVAMAGDRVLMQDTAFFMIHDPMALAWGSIEEIKQILDLLKTVKSGIMAAYETKTGLDIEKLSKMMTAETWMTAKEAKEYGFIDDVIAGKQPKVFENAAIMNALRNYQNVPAALLEQKPVVESVEIKRLRSEVKLYV